jgi:hypothetical protein
MKTLALSAVILGGFACTNDVGVTNGTGSAIGIGPEETQLQNILIPRCRSVCKMMAACPSATDSCDCSGSAASSNSSSSTPTTDCTCSSSATSFDECFSDCLGEVGGRYLNRGETCAAAGADLMDCYAGFDCTSLEQARNGSDPCGTKAAETLCPSQNSSGTTIDTSAATPTIVSAVGGSGATVGGTVAAVGGATGTAIGVGGQTGAGGVAATVGVTCDSSTGMARPDLPSGSAPTANQLLCDGQWSDCSDGHSYRAYCGTSTPELVTCYCIFDGHVQVSFEDSSLLSQVPTANACSDVGITNERCGWSLAVTML